MAVLKFKDVEKMDKKTLDNKLKDLKMELVKANVSANKTNAKTKEIKKAIARILTFTNQRKSDEVKKK
jgi:ribosomal protein L29|tara:strand:+ start:838 stop:1041 length:204 start_codon:yes stop_codon:yes gene_type:complete